MAFEHFTRTSLDEVFVPDPNRSPNSLQSLDVTFGLGLNPDMLCFLAPPPPTKPNPT